VRRAATTLALCLFASQSGTLVLSPILVEVAQDFGVSTAAAGQLRSISGAVAAAVALTVGALAARVGLRRLLLAGLATLALASALSAVAPTFAALAAAQALLGVAIGVLLSSGIAGATAWIARERRADALSATFSGQAVAWLVGMPIVGVVGAVSWRLAWLVLPLTAAMAAFVLAVRLPEAPRRHATVRGDLTALARDRVLAAWWLGEILAFSAWVGMLVYAGALLVDSYGISLASTGLILGAMFVAYLPGTLYFRRHIELSAQRLVVGLGLTAAAVAVLIGAVRPGLWLTVPLLAAYVLLNAGRTIAGSAFGLDAIPGHAVMAMGLRASAAQLGYLLGAAAGGLALHVGGYGALGATLAGLYVLAVLPHAFIASGRQGAVSTGR
jgi:predicted MFS family arabinose efflux permease